MTKSTRIALAPVSALIMTAPLAAAPESQPGWTDFGKAKAGTHVIFVSSTLGDDKNSGLTPYVPVKTIAAGWAKVRDGSSDRLLLRRGDTFNEGIPNIDKSGASEQAMLIIGAYGNAASPRPKLVTPSNGVTAETGPDTPRAHVAVMDLDLTPASYTGVDVYPVGIDFLGPWSDVLIEGCFVHGYANNVTMQGDPVQVFTNLRIRRNVITDSFVVGTSPHSQGLLVGHTTGALIEENVLDHNGWSEAIAGADPTIFRHNVYINPDNTDDITVRRNIIARGAASGLRCCGSVCEDNVLLANPVSIIGAGLTRSITGNVVIDSKDIGTVNQLAKGILGAMHDCVISGNILAHRTNPGTYNIAAIDLETGSDNVKIESNTIFDWAPPASSGQEWVDSSGAITCKGTSTNITVTGNHVQMPRGGRLLWCESDPTYTPTLAGNSWFSPTPAPFQAPATNNGPVGYGAFAAAAPDTGGSFGKLPFSNPYRSAGSYAKLHGWGGTLQDYMMKVRTLEHGRSEDASIFAPAMIEYIEAGFGGAPTN